MPRLLVSSGEPSGDTYAAALVQKLRDRQPGLEVFGLGGDRLLAEDARLVAHVRELAVMGLVEVVVHLRRLRGIFHRLLAEVDRQRPDAAVLVDYPEFNLRLAAELRKRGIPVAYYVSPQVWAWRPGRMRTIRRVVDQMLVIFPFEEELYRAAGVPVTFVGHPLVELVRPRVAATVRAGLGLDPDRPLVALLPGSRRKEIAYNLPTLAGAVDLLAARRPDLQFALALAPSLDAGEVARIVGSRPVRLLHGVTHDVLAAASVALVASGTATVETALLGTPMVVVYRVAPLTYFLGRRLVRVPHVAMVNLIAGRRLVPELLQHDFTPEAVAAEALALLEDPARAAAMRDGLDLVRRRLGEPGASARAAQAVAEMMVRS